MKDYLIPAILEGSTDKYPDLPALSLFGNEPYSYRELMRRVKDLSAWLHQQGIGQGDKVALYSANQPDWAVVYHAVVRMGAVIVPVLPDFSGEDLARILTHSKAKLLIFSQALTAKVNRDQLHTHILEELFPLQEELKEESFTAVQAQRDQLVEADLAALLYTSGTTGQSKGVMLSHGNITRNVLAGCRVHMINPGESALSILPLAHTYECTVGMLLPQYCGGHIVYLGKSPTPTMLSKALSEVRPHMMLAVPLVIEKVYRGKILPTFRKNGLIRFLYSLPPFRNILDRAAGKKMLQNFGGRLEFFGIGGAALAEDVEHFLKRARFPYAIGYGLTETSPLIAGGAPGRFPVRSTGTIIHDMQTRLTDDGELQVKGPTVMMGYYGEPELTAEVLDDDGWFSTGDLCAFDEKGNLFIKGRKKNVIIGASGENIYPENIEALINEFPYVQESLVTDRGGQLVAMIVLNHEDILENVKGLKDKKEALEKWISHHLEHMRKQVNHRVNNFSRISKVQEQDTPFVRTPTQKIKRFLYS